MFDVAQAKSGHEGEGLAAPRSRSINGPVASIAKYWMRPRACYKHRSPIQQRDGRSVAHCPDLF
jgi:hypothetical protein